MLLLIVGLACALPAENPAKKVEPAPKAPLKAELKPTPEPKSPAAAAEEAAPTSEAPANADEKKEGLESAETIWGLGLGGWGGRGMFYG